MGVVFSFFRKPSTKELLHDIQEEINNIENEKRDIEERTRKLGKIIIYLFVAYLIIGLATYWYWVPDTLQDWIYFLTPLACFPPLIILAKRFLNWNFGRMLRNSRGQTDKLRKRKQEILDKVMETETYKVAKEILSEYAPEQLSPLRPNVSMRTPVPSSSMEGVRQRNTPTIKHSTPTSKAGSMMMTSGFNTPRPQITPMITQTPIVNQSLAVRTPGVQNLRTPLRGPQITTPIRHPVRLGAPMPRPAMPRERGVMDKIIDFMMKEGPSNSFALVCSQCETHNGMAPQDEYEYTAYRCSFCHFWNPAKKKRPVAPRLEDSVLPPPPPPASSSSEEESSEEEATQTKEVKPLISNEIKDNEREEEKVEEIPKEDT